MNLIAILAEITSMTSTIASISASLLNASAVVQKMQSEGRLEPTPEERATFASWDDAARQKLIAEMTAALTK